MKDLQTNGSDETKSLLRLGKAIGNYEVIKDVEPALSDGMRKGSGLCANKVRELSRLKQEQISAIIKSLGELGIPVTLPSNQNTLIEYFD